MQISLNDIDDLKKHLEEAIGSKVDAALGKVTAAVQGFDTRVKTLEHAHEAHEARVHKLEQNQAKAIAAWTVMVAAVGTGLTLFFNQVKAWLMGHFRT